MNFDDFIIDDDEFKSGISINDKITPALQKVFDNIAEIANEGSIDVCCGNTKGVSNAISNLANKVTKLIDLNVCLLQSKIIDPSGSEYAFFGSVIDDIGAEVMTEDQIVTKINNIIDSETPISFSDTINYKNKQKEENDTGNNDNPIDGDIDW